MYAGSYKTFFLFDKKLRTRKCGYFLCTLKYVIKEANIDLDAEVVVISDEVVQKIQLDLHCLLFWQPHERSHEQNLTIGAQSFTSLKADLHQDIIRVSSFSRCLNGIFP